MATTPDSAVLNYVIRMVVPMKREFGESLNVQKFMRDASYSQQILAQAQTSQDMRLREYAHYIGRHLQGARHTEPGPLMPDKEARTGHPGAKPSLPPAPAMPHARSAPAAAPAAEGEPTAEELRARMLRKYTGGLR